MTEDAGRDSEAGVGMRSLRSVESADEASDCEAEIIELPQECEALRLRRGPAHKDGSRRCGKRASTVSDPGEILPHQSSHLLCQQHMAQLERHGVVELVDNRLLLLEDLGGYRSERIIRENKSLAYRTHYVPGCEIRHTYERSPDGLQRDDLQINLSVITRRSLSDDAAILDVAILLQPVAEALLHEAYEGTPYKGVDRTKDPTGWLKRVFLLGETGAETTEEIHFPSE